MYGYVCGHLGDPWAEERGHCPEKLPDPDMLGAPCELFPSSTGHGQQVARGPTFGYVCAGSHGTLGKFCPSSRTISSFIKLRCYSTHNSKTQTKNHFKTTPQKTHSRKDPEVQPSPHTPAPRRAEASPAILGPGWGFTFAEAAAWRSEPEE